MRNSCKEFQNSSMHVSKVMLCLKKREERTHGRTNERTRSNMPLQLLRSWEHKNSWGIYVRNFKTVACTCLKLCYASKSVKNGRTDGRTNQKQYAPPTSKSWEHKKHFLGCILLCHTSEARLAQTGLQGRMWSLKRAPADWPAHPHSLAWVYMVFRCISAVARSCKRTVKVMIRLRGCAGWSWFSLLAHAPKKHLGTAQFTYI